ncbi:hypothetical protein K0B04_01405 [Patescibacteria group bacterium]|nr:hypothetical protein [Patescibacteria group bacterium]
MFLVIPVAFWFFTFSEGNDDVQGVRTGSLGVVVKVESKEGSWDMSKFLCKDRAGCLESLNSGKALEKTSGGGLEDQVVTVRYSSDWSQYEFLKIYIEPGWGSIQREFKASLTNEVQGSLIETVTFGGVEYNVVLIPTSVLESGLFEVATFSDN